MSVDSSQLVASMITQMALVQGSITTVGNLQGTSPVVLATLYSALQSATAPFDTAIAAYDADIDTTTFGGVSLGLPAPTLAAQLLNQALDVKNQALAVAARAVVGRAAVNVGNAPG